MNRRRFLLSLPVLALAPTLLAARRPALYPVQYAQRHDGTEATLLWDGDRRFRVECQGRAREYVHPRRWTYPSAEFYAMQEKAQVMLYGLLYVV